ncbi:MAG: hypothetical protein HYZ09_02875, partial [Candidatus Kerfeldbacteria bacterium]|nr:hypothetical protein [Candidatus Kerfeldbacteria bacterium]
MYRHTILAVTLTAATLVVGIVAAQVFPNTFSLRSTPTVSVFYSVGEVIRFDRADNPIGRVTLYRVDGMSGRPQAIYEMPGEHFLPLAGAFDAQELQFYTTETLDTESPWFYQTVIERRIDRDGRLVRERKLDSGVPSNPIEVASSDGRYRATAGADCRQSVVDVPCPLAFSIALHDEATGETKTLTPDTFGVSEHLVIEPAAFDDSNSQLIVATHAQHELAETFLLAVDLNTETVTTLFAGSTYAENPSDFITYRAYRTSANGKRLFIGRNNLGGVPDTMLLELDLATLESREVASIPGYLEPLQFAPDDSGVMVQLFENFETRFF